MSDVQWSVGEIHLPHTLNEEAIADEFSVWEQVSSPASGTLRSPHTGPCWPRMLSIPRPPIPPKKDPCSQKHESQTMYENQLTIRLTAI
ncbi:hypothetical protein E5259_24175 [Blautia producta]|uniref:Uncharacterized protein n=1 Tax=Blautia producta TaxID=33035 RepID=A0A7G5N0P3_9FIRM|nr:hypothetical protein E5259_24175 [Blautia producta]